MSNLLADMTIKEILEIKVVLEDLADSIKKICDISELIISSIKVGGKVMCCGNGGSAANAMHFVDDLVGRFKFERPGLPCICLGVNYVVISALGNDYGYERVFSREVEALGKPGDVLVTFSSSGNSENVIEALTAARKKGIKTVCFSGKGGGKAAGLADLSFVVKSNNSSIVENIHQVVMHCVCQNVEFALFEKEGV